MQTFPINNKTLHTISLKKVLFPASKKVEIEVKAATKWKAYKHEIQQHLSKSRWPILPDQLIELPSGKSLCETQGTINQSYSVYYCFQNH